MVAAVLLEKSSWLAYRERVRVSWFLGPELGGLAFFSFFPFFF